MKISIIIPCYNVEEHIFFCLSSLLKQTFGDWEAILVNDGSKDNTLELMRKLATNKNVRYISFSRNFGKEAAMYAGLKSSTGDYVAIMDADVQETPALLQ